jgi:hypothetical protein
MQTVPNRRQPVTSNRVALAPPMIKIAPFILAGIFLVALTVINLEAHPTNHGIANILLCLGGLLFLGLISVNRSFRRRWSKAGPSPANWIGLVLALFLGCSSKPDLRLDFPRLSAPDTAGNRRHHPLPGHLNTFLGRVMAAKGDC